MSKIKHTPGPWGLDTTLIYAKSDQRSDGMIEYDSVGYIAEMGNKTDPEWEANAHLITAAPDLLEALEAILRLHNEITIAKAEIAIAKAKGA